MFRNELLADELKYVAFVDEFKTPLALSCWVLLAFRDELVADEFLVAVITTIETEYPT